MKKYAKQYLKKRLKFFRKYAYLLNPIAIFITLLSFLIAVITNVDIHLIFIAWALMMYASLWRALGLHRKSGHSHADPERETDRSAQMKSEENQ